MIAILDIVYIGLFFILTVRGWIRGFIKEVFSLCSLLLSFFTALLFFRSLARWGMKQWGELFWITPAAFLFLFLVVYLVLKILENLLGRMITNSIFNGPDKLLGFLLGGIEGVIFCMILTLALISQPFIELDKIFDSSIIAVWILHYLPVVQELSRSLIKSF